MEILTVGSKAYIDAFGGLIPCTVEAISGTSGIASSSQMLTVRVTSNKAGYQKGEILQRSGLSIIPRGSVRRNRYGATILAHTVQV